MTECVSTIVGLDLSLLKDRLCWTHLPLMRFIMPVLVTGPRTRDYISPLVFGSWTTCVTETVQQVEESYETLSISQHYQ